MAGVRHERKTQDYFPAGTRFRPLHNRILVKVLPLKLSDRIIADWKGSCVRGEIVAAGPGKYPNLYTTGKRDGKDFKLKRQSRHFRPTEVKVGQVVYLGGMEIGGYIWQKIYVGHQEHIWATENDVCGIESDAAEARPGRRDREKAHGHRLRRSGLRAVDQQKQAHP